MVLKIRNASINYTELESLLTSSIKFLIILLLLTNISLTFPLLHVIAIYLKMSAQKTYFLLCFKFILFVHSFFDCFFQWSISASIWLFVKTTIFKSYSILTSSPSFLLISKLTLFKHRNSRSKHELDSWLNILISNLWYCSLSLLFSPKF